MKCGRGGTSVQIVINAQWARHDVEVDVVFFFFKQKTAYEI